MKGHIYFLLFIIIFNLVIYYPVYSMGFLYEDYLYLSCLDRNIVKHYVKSFLFKDVEKPFPNPRPLMRIFWFLNSKIFGYDNVLAFHLINLALHILCAFLLYWLVLDITRQKDLSLLSTIIFSSLACNAMVVSWLCCGWYIITAILIIISIFILKKLKTSKFKILLYLLLLFTGSAAFAVNEMSISLPIILLMYDLLILSKGEKINFKKKVLFYLPFFVLIILCFFRTGITSSYPNIVFDFITNPNKPIPPFKELLQHLLGLIIQIMYNFKIILYPFKFTAIIIVLYLLLFETDFKKILFFIGWYFITLIPVILVIFLDDRIMYIPSLGFSVLLAYTFLEGLKTMKENKSFGSSLLTILLCGTFFWLFLTINVMIPLIGVFVLIILKKLFKKKSEAGKLLIPAGKILQIAVIVTFILFQSFFSIKKNLNLKSQSVPPSREWRASLLKVIEKRDSMENVAFLSSFKINIYEHNKGMLKKLLEWN
ncbi:hypothetical protein KKB18_07850 [bacterium]|nr:hypothetical protein [bacterium]